jgi:outer membrane protein OmpA-like peptidoglycan-associated protein
MQAGIVGYSDNAGDPASNHALSEACAAAVRQALVTAGVGAHGMATAGIAEPNPIADNATGSGRAPNRRKEFEIAPMSQMGVERRPRPDGLRNVQKPPPAV